jgi:Fe-S cluster assembly iron-binding protein IscA
VSNTTAPIMHSHIHVRAQIISIAPRALEHLLELKKSKGDQGIILRMGVRSGGCSGLSYVMDLVEESAVMEEDMIEEYPEVSNSFCKTFVLIITCNSCCNLRRRCSSSATTLRLIASLYSRGQKLP